MSLISSVIVLLAVFGYSAPNAYLSSAATAAPRLVKTERVKIAIEGMHCESCARGIKAMLKRTPGVISAEVSYEQREATVEYDTARTTPEKITEAINNLGYKAKVKEGKDTR